MSFGHNCETAAHVVSHLFRRASDATDATGATDAGEADGDGTRCPICEQELSERAVSSPCSCIASSMTLECGHRVHAACQLGLGFDMRYCRRCGVMLAGLDLLVDTLHVKYWRCVSPDLRAAVASSSREMAERIIAASSTSVTGTMTYDTLRSYHDGLVAANYDERALSTSIRVCMPI